MEFDSVLKKFGIENARCRKIGNGHINATFLAETETERYILQRINTNVFTDPVRTTDNIVRVTDHIAKRSFTVRPLPTVTGGYVELAPSGAFRVLTYADGEVKERVSSADDMYAVGRGFGTFQKNLADFDEPLFETIPHFHDTPARYARLIAAAKSSDRRADELLNGFVSLKGIADSIVAPLVRGELPARVAHNDTKLNNIVLKDGEPLCVIDLDTVMSGSLLYDFGDAVRSGCNCAAEDAPANEAGVNFEYLEAFAEGFLHEITDISAAEKRLLAISPAVLGYECGMRFLTDYLEYDRYFGARYPEQNLHRAENQFSFVEKYLAETDRAESLIQKIL